MSQWPESGLIVQQWSNGSSLTGCSVYICVVTVPFTPLNNNRTLIWITHNLPLLCYCSWGSKYSFQLKETSLWKYWLSFERVKWSYSSIITQSSLTTIVFWLAISLVFAVYFCESISTPDLWFKLIAYTNNNAEEAELLKREVTGAARNPLPVPTVKASEKFPVLQKELDFVGYFIFGEVISWNTCWIFKLFPPLGTW